MIPGGRSGVVKSTTTAPTVERGDPKTVKSIFKLDHFVVQYFDEDGTGHVDVVMRVGEQLYASPFGEDWCSKLGPTQSWLGNEVLRRVTAKEKGVDPASIPSTDAVDVMGSGIAKRIGDASKATVKAGSER